MDNCSKCVNWHYHYPDDMGICTAPGGPGNGNGFSVPMEQAVVSSAMRKAYSGKGMQATSCDTLCDKFSADPSLQVQTNG